MAKRKGAYGPRIRSGQVPTRNQEEEFQGKSPESAGDIAACFGLVDIFFGPSEDLRDEHDSTRKRREAICQAICEGCPIRRPCLWWAVTEKEEYGVWGGVAYRERQRFRKWLKKEGYSKIPEEEGLDEALEEFRQTPKEKARRPKKVIDLNETWKAI